MKPLYQHTARVGLIKACLRMIEDPARPLIIRIATVISPLMIVWLLSPIDPMPEVVLGPLGLLDDGAIVLTLFFLLRLANTFYRTRKYLPSERLDDNDNMAR